MSIPPDRPCRVHPRNDSPATTLQAGRARSPGARAVAEASAARVPLTDYATLYQAAPLEHIHYIRDGIDALEVSVLAERMGITKEQLVTSLGIPRATLNRKAKAQQLVSIEQGERVIGMAKLIGQVEMMVRQSGNPDGFDAAHWLGDWLARPNPALHGRRPSELMDTAAGQALVSSLLAQAQSGAYA